MTATEVFLFAHPDDEFGVFLALEEAARRGAPILCLYLTDGAFAGQSSVRREAETRGVLKRLGVHLGGVHFIGRGRGFGDGRLHLHLDEALEAIALVLDDVSDIGTLYLHAWEGGHQDHDAAHLLGLAYAVRRGLVDACRQFPLYRQGPGLLNIATCAPLDRNGLAEARPIPLGRRLAYLAHCLSYGSQRKSFLFLLPALALHYVTRGVQELQPVRADRARERPHQGALLYERRGFSCYEDFDAASRAFVRANIPAGQAVNAGR